MRIIIVGPGRAGGAMAVASHLAGHDIVGVYARRPDDQIVATQVARVAEPIGTDLPAADLIVVAVHDDALTSVAEQLAPVAGKVTGAVHLSGLVATSALEPLSLVGVDIGAFHPLQTLPSWKIGARSLAGAHVAVTAGEALGGVLVELADSLGAKAFHLADEVKPLYHAAAAASANYVVAALALAGTLFEAANVDQSVSRPLVESVVANAFDLGAAVSLTGPIARGDIGTVATQIRAIGEQAPGSVESFKALGRLTAELAGTDELMRELLS